MRQIVRGNKQTISHKVGVKPIFFPSSHSFGLYFIFLLPLCNLCFHSFINDIFRDISVRKFTVSLPRRPGFYTRSYEDDYLFIYFIFLVFLRFIFANSCLLKPNILLMPSVKRRTISNRGNTGRPQWAELKGLAGNECITTGNRRKIKRETFTHDRSQCC
jgi:hypothetical protein